MTNRILVVEDEPSLQETLVYNLNRQGYETAVSGDGVAAVQKRREFEPDLVILDVMLPQLDGFEVCRIMRQESSAPILMLTARDEEFDLVLGLELGADDYLTKPFSMRELLTRVKTLLRRVRLDQGIAETDKSLQNLVFDNLEIDQNRRTVSLNGNILALKPKEFDLLVYLAKNKQRVFTRNQILSQVWGWDFSGGSRTVDVHISWLREKIEINPEQPQRLVTVRGVGYRFDG